MLRLALFFILLISITLNLNSHGDMTKQYTLSIIKPDATARNLTNEINQIFTKNNLQIAIQKKMTLSEEQAKNFYIEHKDRPFYMDLVHYMISGEVVVQVLAGEDAIAQNRKIMGATNPKDAAEGTIRAKYAESLERNSVHGSDSPKSAKREITFFFDYDELTAN